MSITDSSAAVTASSVGVTLTASATANTKGAYTELISSTSEETYWVQLVLKCPLGLQDESMLIDLAVGAASSEIVNISNIYMYVDHGGIMTLTMPLTIASGSRVSARCQATTGSQTLEAMIYLSNNSEFGTSTVNETIGADTSVSKGTDIDPGGTDNTKGAYAELVASTSNEYNYWVICMANADNSAQTNQDYLVDIATGASSSDVDQIANIPFVSSSLELTSVAPSFFHTIAASTRVSARCQSSDVVTAGTNDRLIDLVMIGFKLVAPSGGGGMIVHPGMAGGMRG